ncbi:MAG: copper resistance protein CopC/CopD [Pyrinomonadaceae bacterium]|nr:copper resistance protein CopC/CopD [Pyrinomonadaceae bacterium]
MNQRTGGHLSYQRQLARGLFVGLLLAFLSVAALAHAKLERSEPKNNSTLQQAPKLVELWFSEELESGFNSIEVKDQQGKRFDQGGVTLSEGNKKAQIALAPLGAGIYVIVWKALSLDQHTLRGEFTFTLARGAEPGAATASPSQGPGSAAMDSMPMGKSEQDYEIYPSQSAVRGLSYLSMMMLFGGFALYLLVLAPALSQESLQEPAKVAQVRNATACRIVKWSWISVLLLLLTSSVSLVFQVSGVFDKSFVESFSPSLLGQVIFNTGYGGHWFLEILSIALLIVILAILTRQLKGAPDQAHRVLWWVGLFAGAVLLLAPSWTGHALASVKDFRLAVVTDWLHLLAGGFWLGGLFHLAITLPSLVVSVDKRHRIGLLAQVIKRFTRVAMPSVGLLVLAGLYNTWVHVPSLSGLWMTPYGKTLLLKLFFVGLMLLLGGLNNFHFGKRVARLAQMQGKADNDVERLKLERGFARSVVSEAAIGVIVLLVTSALVFMTPARSHPAMSPDEHPVRSSAGSGQVSHRWSKTTIN